MSYDHYLAICKPLHYTTLMTNRVCHQLVLSSWATGFLMIFPSVILGLKLEFWFQHHWSFCLWFSSHPTDLLFRYTFPRPDVLFLGCGDTDGHTDVSDSLLRLYHQDNSQILSVQQRTKAFSTCYSHMIVVSISYGSCIFMYIKASVNDRVTLNKGVAVLNTSVAPLLNPFIYTLRN